MRKFLNLFLVFTFIFVLASCGGTKTVQEKWKDGDTINVGIVQYVTATPLDDARAGIVAALASAGMVDGENIVINVYNPEANASTLGQMVKSALSENDILFAIATPVAQSLVQQSEKEGSEIPIFFTAVTDPVDSDIVSDASNPGSNVTGTSDMNPVADQIAFFDDLCPSGTKLGFIYSANETNSIAQLTLAQAKSTEMGIQLVAQSMSSVNDLVTTLNSLITGGIDALFLPTDNILSANNTVVVNRANEAGIPTICGDASFVDVGGTLTLGINYRNLGQLTGEMAVSVIKGEQDIKTMAVQKLTSFELAVNNTVATASGITIPASIISDADSVK